MSEKTKFKERRSKIKMKNKLEKVNFLQSKNNIRERGITLIALVVTIIVLLILASISISVILGDNGLIEMAREAGRKTNEAVEKEQGDIANITNEIKDYVNGTTEEKTLVQMFKDGELKVGDYINYENPTEGSYTADVEKTGSYHGNQTFSVENNDLHWRVLGIDEATGGLKLISGRPIKRKNVDGWDTNNPYFYMDGANAYEYGITELNNISKIFMNEKYAQDVRSVTIEDINEAVGIKTEEDINRVNLAENYNETYSFDNQYTPKSWLDNEQQTTVSGTSNGYYYSINSEEEPTVKVNETLFDMLFDNTDCYDEDSWGNGAMYWLASQSRYYDGSYVSFGLYMVECEQDVWNDFCNQGSYVVGGTMEFSSDRGPYSGYSRLRGSSCSYSSI